ncbi:MAG: ADP-ribosylglycohydrolase family protein, partial [Victivallales bacterium]|nr:ADP-ribosylglycohydrolase family protein [Victivallales bacterium]
WLEALQERGIWIESDDLAEFWQDRCWYNFAEYGVFLNNFQRGIHPPLSGTWNNNFYFESEGCPIRSEIWGLVCPGNPQLAADYARKDGELDHGGASVLCEMFLAAADAAAFFDDDLDRVLDAGLSVLPAGSVVHEMVREIRRICAAYPRFEDAWRLIVRRFGDRDFSKAIMNQAIVVMALILGCGDFAETMRLAINSGWDTDCTAATAGALLGIMHGSSILPAEWVEKMGKNIACDINVKHRTVSFEILAEDTARLGVEIALERNRDVQIPNAPEVVFRPPPDRGIKMKVSYPSEPVLCPGRNTPLRLHFNNDGDKALSGTWRIEAPAPHICSRSEGVVTLNAGESVEIELLVSVPPSGPLWDKNLFDLHWNSDDGRTRSYRFGICGARLWRTYGPYFDMWDTLKNEVCSYNHDGVFTFPNDGDAHNHYVRLEKAYLDEARLLMEDIPEELPEEIQAGTEYLDGAEIAGFRGPACFYLVRELVAREPCNINFHITTNVPIAIWFDGKEISRREEGREVSLQDGFIESVQIGPIPKRLVLKLARKSDFLSLCVTAMAKEYVDPKRIRGVSVFADVLGDMPMTFSQK